MLFLRACPRCRTGAVEYASDQWGPYLSCLNCGYLEGRAYTREELNKIGRVRGPRLFPVSALQTKKIETGAPV